MNEKLKEFLSVGVCLCLLIGIGFYTGFFNETNLNNVQNVIKSAKSDASNMKFDFKNANGKGDSTRVNGYLTNNIPKDVLDGAERSGFWSNIFRSNKKVIFYMYDRTETNHRYTMDFHERLTEAYNSGRLSDSYAFEPSELFYFKNYNVGIVGSTRVCNSMQECNDMVSLSKNRGAMQSFLDRCGRTFCIINMKNKKFVILRDRDATKAIDALRALSKW